MYRIDAKTDGCQLDLVVFSERVSEEVRRQHHLAKLLNTPDVAPSGSSATVVARNSQPGFAVLSDECQMKTRRHQVWCRASWSVVLQQMGTASGPGGPTFAAWAKTCMFG